MTQPIGIVQGRRDLSGRSDPGRRAMAPVCPRIGLGAAHGGERAHQTDRGGTSESTEGVPVPGRPGTRHRAGWSHTVRGALTRLVVDTGRGARALPLRAVPSCGR